MSIKNKLLLISIDKNHQRTTPPIRVNLNLDLDGRNSRASKKGGYLTSRLASYKQSLEAMPKTNREQKQQQHESPPRYLKESRRVSLQLLPKLHQYDFPVQQIPVQEKIVREKPNNKILSMRILNENREKKKRLRNLEQKDLIDNILLQMLSEEGAVHNKIRTSLQNSEQLMKDKLLYNRKSVDPRIQSIVCQGKQLSSNFEQLKNEIRELSYRKHQSTTNGSDSKPIKKAKKVKQLKGWDIEHQNDIYDF